MCEVGRPGGGLAMVVDGFSVADTVAVDGTEVLGAMPGFLTRSRRAEGLAPALAASHPGASGRGDLPGLGWL